MELERIDIALSVCKAASLDPALLEERFCFTGRTDEELSLVCPTGSVPPEVLEREDGWRAFRIRGVLDFSLVGILAPIASLLAEARIGIFAVSTFNTDYILVREWDYERALGLLAEHGYTVV